MFGKELIAKIHVGFFMHPHQQSDNSLGVRLLNRPGSPYSAAVECPSIICRGTLGSLANVHRDQERQRFGRGALSHRRGHWGAAQLAHKQRGD
jgi:hypothetical protein